MDSNYRIHKYTKRKAKFPGREYDYYGSTTSIADKPGFDNALQVEFTKDELLECIDSQDDVEEFIIDDESQALTFEADRVARQMKASNPTFERLKREPMSFILNKVALLFPKNGWNNDKREELHRKQIDGLSYLDDEYSELLCDNANNYFINACNAGCNPDETISAIGQSLTNHGTCYPYAAMILNDPNLADKDFDLADEYRNAEMAFEFGRLLSEPYDQNLPSNNTDSGPGLGNIYPDGKPSTSLGRSWCLKEYCPDREALGYTPLARQTTFELRSAWAGKPGLRNFVERLVNAPILYIPKVFGALMRNYNVSMCIQGDRNNNMDELISSLMLKAAEDAKQGKIHAIWKNVDEMLDDLIETGKQKARRANLFVSLRKAIAFKFSAMKLKRVVVHKLQRLFPKMRKRILLVILALAINRRRPINANINAQTGFAFTMLYKQNLHHYELLPTGILSSRKELKEAINQIASESDDYFAFFYSGDTSNAELKCTSSSEFYYYSEDPWWRAIDHCNMISVVPADLTYGHVTGGKRLGCLASGIVNTTYVNWRFGDIRKRELAWRTCIDLKLIHDMSFEEFVFESTASAHRKEVYWQVNEDLRLVFFFNTDDVKILFLVRKAKARLLGFTSADALISACNNLGWLPDWFKKNSIEGAFVSYFNAFGVDLTSHPIRISVGEKNKFSKAIFTEKEESGIMFALKMASRQDTEWPPYQTAAISKTFESHGFPPLDAYKVPAADALNFLRRTGFSVALMYNIHSTSDADQAKRFLAKYDFKQTSEGFVAGTATKSEYIAGEEIKHDPVHAPQIYTKDVMYDYDQAFKCYIREHVSDKLAAKYIGMLTKARFPKINEVIAEWKIISTMPSLSEFAKAHDLEILDFRREFKKEYDEACHLWRL